MSDKKRKSEGTDHKRKKKYRSDGTPIWEKRQIDGPGVWVSCVKGKEKQTVGEIYDVFEALASEIWPINEDGNNSDSESDEGRAELSLEAQIVNEVSAMKRPRTENPTQQRFANCHTNTQCVVFISCKPPVDPVKLVLRYVQSVVDTGVTRTRYVQRLVPVSGTCLANLPEIEGLCRKVFSDFFMPHGDKKFTYKIELRVRNHSTISRPELIQHLASCFPEGHKVDLDDPQIFILVEVFKSICGVSIVEDYYRLQKFNVMEIASKKNNSDQPSGSRLRTATGSHATTSALPEP